MLTTTRKGGSLRSLQIGLKTALTPSRSRSTHSIRASAVKQPSLCGFDHTNQLEGYSGPYLMVVVVRA